MKNKPYDYRGFSLSRLGEPRFRHALLLGGWLAYFALYFLTENLIPAERCHVIHCALDDRIPFNEGFVFFYVGWYFLVFGSLAWTFFFDVERFRKLQIFIMITQAAAMLTYILYPSVQNLRPAADPADRRPQWSPPGNPCRTQHRFSRRIFRRTFTRRALDTVYLYIL